MIDKPNLISRVIAGSTPSNLLPVTSHLPHGPLVVTEKPALRLPQSNVALYLKSPGKIQPPESLRQQGLRLQRLYFSGSACTFGLSIVLDQLHFLSSRAKVFDPQRAVKIKGS
jgi:hypothetical protein